jgi:hypothetical protein
MITIVIFSVIAVGVLSWMLLTWFDDEVDEPLPDRQQNLHEIQPVLRRVDYDYRVEYGIDGVNIYLGNEPRRPPTLEDQIRVEFSSRTRYSAMGSVILAWKEMNIKEP